MPNHWERQPRIPEFLIWIPIIGIIGYLLFPNLLRDIYSNLTLTPTTPSLTDINLPNTYDSNTLSSSDSLSQLFPSVDNTLNSGSGNNALSSGYWVLFVSNGISQQLSISAQDYAFIQGLIQSDRNGSARATIFLIDNGQIHQHIVSNEIYSVLSNMATVIARASTTSTSTNLTPPLSMLPTTAISEALTVSNPSTSGFKVGLNPALNGLTTSNFTLVNSLGNPVYLTGATTSDNGATYAITAALSADQTYTLTVTNAGYTLGTAQNVTVASTAVSQMLTVSSPSTSGFTVVVNPALNGLTLSNFTLINSLGNPVYLTGATTSDNGATYAITAALSAGQTYTLTVTNAGYTLGTSQNVVVPL